MKKYRNKQEWEEEVNDKTVTFFNLLKMNEIPPAINGKLNDVLRFLCSAKSELNIKLNGSRTCAFCGAEFMLNQNKEPPYQSACKCMSFHQKCLMGLCKQISKDLDPVSLENGIKCLHCGKPFTRTFLELTLGDELAKEQERIFARKNRKVTCNICNRDVKFDLMYERHCGHSYCINCFTTYLENILRRNRGNIRDFVCPVEVCKESRIDNNEMKIYVSKPVWNIYDDYLYRIYDPKKQNEVVYKCKTDDCPKIRGATLEAKEKEYQCLDCETKMKEGQVEENKN